MKRALPLVVLLVASSAWGQQFRRTATSGFVFLELPVTARGAALGETSIALTDLKSAGVFSNPASLGWTEETHAFSVSYAPWFADIRHLAASYGYSSALGVLAISAIVLDYGTMDRYVVTPGLREFNSSGTFRASSQALGLSYARQLTNRFSFGVSFKYVFETIDAYRAKNVVFDAGVLYETGFESLRIAGTIQNFGTEARFINESFKMPAVLRLGVAGEFLGDRSEDFALTGLVEAVHPSDADERVNAGLELTWRHMLQLRGGYKFFYDEETYSLGVGFAMMNVVEVPVGLDFAYSDYGRLGGIVRFTMDISVL